MSWETFRVGDFVIVYRDKFHRESKMIFDGYASKEIELGPAEYSGVPMEILGIALPYLACRNVDNNSHFTVDLRRWDVRVCDKKYVSVFVKEGDIYKGVKGTVSAPISKDTTTGLCPMCKEKMIEYRSDRVELGYSTLSMRCKKCKIECREYK